MKPVTLDSTGPVPGLPIRSLPLAGTGREVLQLMLARGERLDWFETGVRYHLYHALGLLLVGAMASREGAPKALSFASAAFLLGIVLFSGSLYAMSLAPDGWSKLGAVVPLGGLSLIIGWIILAGATWKR